jgi:hypothetical protein
MSRPSDGSTTSPLTKNTATVVVHRGAAIVRQPGDRSAYRKQQLIAQVRGGPRENCNCVIRHVWLCPLDEQSLCGFPWLLRPLRPIWFLPLDFKESAGRRPCVSQLIAYFLGTFYAVLGRSPSKRLRMQERLTAQIR